MNLPPRGLRYDSFRFVFLCERKLYLIYSHALGRRDKLSLQKQAINAVRRSFSSLALEKKFKEEKEWTKY